MSPVARGQDETSVAKTADPRSSVAPAPGATGRTTQGSEGSERPGGLLSAGVFAWFLSTLLVAWRGWRHLFDAECMARVTDAFLFDHTHLIEIPGLQGLSPCKFGIGQSVLLAPFALLARAIAPFGSGELIAFERDVMSLCNPLVVAVLGTVLFRTAATLGLTKGRAWLLACLGIFATPFWTMAQYGNSEPVTSLLILWAALLLCDRTSRRSVLAGALAGFAILTKPNEIPTVMAMGVVLLVPFGDIDARARVRQALSFAVGLAPLGAIHVGYNYLRYGLLQPMSHPSPDGKAEALGFHTPWSVGLPGILWGPATGCLRYAPLLLLAVLLLPLLARSHRMLASLGAGAFLAQLLVHAKWDTWFGGGTWGPRLMMPVAPLVTLALLPALRRSRGGLFVVVLLVGALSMAVNFVGLLHEYSPLLDRNGITGHEDILKAQLALISPRDLNEFVSMRSTSGTFWPTFTDFGVSAVTISALLGILVLRATSRPRRWFWGAVFAVPVLFLAGRERFIPYRVEDRTAGPPAGSRPLPLDTAQVTSLGKSRPAASPLRLRGPSAASIEVFLPRGRYALAMDLSGDPDPTTLFTYELRLVADQVAVGQLASSTGPLLVTSKPFRIKRRGTYTLQLVTEPVSSASGSRRDLFRKVMWCQSLSLESLAEGAGSR